ncbi:hypothetical protein PRK78_001871 [Emydomyces testavorans]|uniref:Uncharacterized protein n=1 Tax=Emydomyces testavorans TaxID=2070801 RepID=A0AAF0IH33_9EURO|nr:hypothetical protein PRK78_001871 [Emydomyces testavorans]
MVESAIAAPVSKHRQGVSQARRRSASPSSLLRRLHYNQSLNSARGSPVYGNLQRASTFSDTLSGARQSIKSSTDDLIRPRSTVQTDESHWQSAAPLALALVPALGGVFFRNGSAVLTDITLLCLAAVFLNWSVRLPWDWYHSAQEAVVQESLDDEFDTEDIIEESKTDSAIDAQEAVLTHVNKKAIPQRSSRTAEVALKARRELHTYEFIALTSCFICPVLGSWLLHAIRSQLSRPSEGLISNYNLTIFLFAAEIRPFSHLLKLVQARTLYLQQVVRSASQKNENVDANKVLDLARRLNELETHVAGHVTRETGQILLENGRNLEQKVRHIVQTCKVMQGDIEALNRAVRKYEKRLTISSLETDARIDDLESRVHSKTLDTTSINPQVGFLWRLIRAFVQSVLMALLLPWRVLRSITTLPILITKWLLTLLIRILNLNPHPITITKERGSIGSNRVFRQKDRAVAKPQQ